MMHTRQVQHRQQAADDDERAGLAAQHRYAGKHTVQEEPVAEWMKHLFPLTLKQY